MDTVAVVAEKIMIVREREELKNQVEIIKDELRRERVSLSNQNQLLQNELDNKLGETGTGEESTKCKRVQA